MSCSIWTRDIDGRAWHLPALPVLRSADLFKHLRYASDLMAQFLIGKFVKGHLCACFFEILKNWANACNTSTNFKSWLGWHIAIDACSTLAKTVFDSLKGSFLSVQTISSTLIRAFWNEDELVWVNLVSCQMYQDCHANLHHFAITGYFGPFIEAFAESWYGTATCLDFWVFSLLSQF